jgi:hypothetical protein
LGVTFAFGGSPRRILAMHSVKSARVAAIAAIGKCTGIVGCMDAAGDIGRLRSEQRSRLRAAIGQSRRHYRRGNFLSRPT